MVLTDPRRADRHRPALYRHPPALARLAHIRAVLAIRLSLQHSHAHQQGQARWRSERRIRATAGAIRAGHLPDAEISWPEVPASPYPGQCWAIEAELTPKPLARTTTFMSATLTRTTDYQPGVRTGPGPRYDQVIYLVGPAARNVVDRAADAVPGALLARLTVRDLPDGALL
jgi:hypothetical protein